MSATAVVVWWRDIPAQVIVRAGRATAKRELPRRFIEAIDRAAMREGLSSTDAYLDQWRRGVPVACGGDLEAEADRAAAELISRYGPDRLKVLAECGGREAS